MTRHRFLRGVWLALAALIISLPITADARDQDQAAKIHVSDGSAAHHAGLTWLNITNFGTIGSRYTVPSDMSDAGSMRYPGEDGREHLWTGALWVGGVVLGERCVSTGEYDREFRPTDDPLDTIYKHAAGCVGGLRYPEAGADDDGDGLEDEDERNGRDDDGDGLIDEDFAAFGAEYFVCTMWDDTPLASEYYPDHTPMHLEVLQESFQFDDPLNDDYVGLRYTIRNTGVVTIDDVYVGFFADFDIDGTAGDNPDEAENDAFNYIEDLVPVSDGSDASVRMVYAWDNTVEALSGHAGIALLSNDPRAARIFTGQASFSNGGDPTNDSERYTVLSTEQVNHPRFGEDGRVVISCGPWSSLAPGEEIEFDIALVCGADLDALKSNAAEAQRCYEGYFFDRDGDPLTGEDGKEFQVHWLREQDNPTPAMFGILRGRIAQQRAHLSLEAGGTAVEHLLVRRAPRGDFAGREWRVADLGGTELGTDHEASIIDDDAIGWPRSYSLVFSANGTELVLDEVMIDAPAMQARVSASPNPFNPQVEIRWSQPEPGPVSLEIFDGRGRLVRHLLNASRPAGEDTVTWAGRDDSGRSLASGVYVVRLTTARGVASESVTLVR